MYTAITRVIPTNRSESGDFTAASTNRHALTGVQEIRATASYQYIHANDGAGNDIKLVSGTTLYLAQSECKGN